MPTKITLIGAGSVVFAKNLISDILQFAELEDCHLCLMDIDAARLKVAEAMASRVVSKLGVAATVSATLDRTEAIRGAKYVICTIQVGGYEPGTVIDFEIPKKYGLRQTIADTLGVGGVFRALRTIPKLIDIARDIEQVAAPGCLFLNYSNPMAMNCMAVDQAVGVPMVGLCHSVQGTSKQLANYLGLDVEDVSYQVAGINHMAFFLEYKYRGRDIYPLLFKLLEDPDFKQDKVRFEMMRRLGYFVTESSEHQSEYSPYFIHHGDEMVDRFDIPLDEYIRRCQSIVATWKQTESDLLGKGGEIEVKPQTHEYGSYIIHSMETGIPRVVYGNVPNRGLITNLPDGCCVEVATLVDRAGLQPTFIGDLPPQLASICRSNINVQELVVAAALSGKREHIYHAVMADPHTAAALRLDQIWAMCDELIEAHGKEGYFPDFASTVVGTGRTYSGTGDKVFARIEAADETAGELTLELRNETGSRYAGAVDLEVKEASGRSRSVATVEVDLADGEAFSQSVSIGELGLAERQPYSLLPVSADGVVCGLPFESRERVEVNVPCFDSLPEVDERGNYCDGAVLEMEFMSVPLLSGRLFLSNGNLHVSARVHDTDTKVHSSRPWEKSNIEFRYRRFGSGAREDKIFFVPVEGRGALRSRSNRQSEENVFETRVDAGGYAMRGSLDLAALGLEAGKPFLFDLIVSVGALGDAHGACRVAWCGKASSGSATPSMVLLSPRPE